MSPSKARKFIPQEESQILMGINTYKIDMHTVDSPMGLTTLISCNSFTTAGSYAGIVNKLEKEEYKKKPTCHLLYKLSSTPNVITVDCNIPVEPKSEDERLGLIDIEDIVKEITSTPEGARQWEEAKTKVNAELRQKVVDGKMSKLKYYRMIRGFTQKDLADKAMMQQPDISRYEQLGYKATVPTYEKLAEILGVEYRDLIP